MRHTATVKYAAKEPQALYEKTPVLIVMTGEGYDAAQRIAE